MQNAGKEPKRSNLIKYILIILIIILCINGVGLYFIIRVNSHKLRSTTPSAQESMVTKKPELPKPVLPKPKQSEPSKVKQTPSQSAGLTYLRKNSSGYEEYRHNKTGIILIKIPAGTFSMGSTDGVENEEPIHKVFLEEYYIGKYEVTNEQYKTFCAATDSKYPDHDFTGMPNYFSNYLNYPVVYISWEDAKAFCNWAGLRLPSVAEWEKAARGTDAREYPWGNETPDAGGFYRANYNSGDNEPDGYRYTSPVGTYERGKSPYGCYDMAGNVWEWCQDLSDKEYYGGNNAKEFKSFGRVLRGGSCNAPFSEKDVSYLRCAFEYWYNPRLRWLGIEGFRVGFSI